MDKLKIGQEVWVYGYNNKKHRGVILDVNFTPDEYGDPAIYPYLVWCVDEDGGHTTLWYFESDIEPTGETYDEIEKIRTKLLQEEDFEVGDEVYTIKSVGGYYLNVGVVTKVYSKNDINIINKDGIPFPKNLGKHVHWHKTGRKYSELAKIFESMEKINEEVDT